MATEMEEEGCGGSDTDADDSESERARVRERDARLSQLLRNTSGKEVTPLLPLLPRVLLRKSPGGMACVLSVFVVALVVFVVGLVCHVSREPYMSHACRGALVS